MKILITGAAGFIGFFLSKRLLERGDEVVGIDALNDYYDVNLKYGRLGELGVEASQIAYGQAVTSSQFTKYQFLHLNLEDNDNLVELFKAQNFDKVCNLAAQAGVRYSLINPHAYIQSNIVGFANLLECCRHFNIQHFAYASSSSVYGLNETMPLSTAHNVDHPVSLYAASKKSNELMAHTYSHLYKLPTTGLRFFTVYGPWGRPDMAYFLFTDAILSGRPIKVFNFGDMSRDFTYIDDIVEGVVRILDNPPKGDPNWSGLTPNPAASKAPYRVYNIGNNDPVRLMDFIEAIEKALDKEAVKEYLPIQPGDVQATYADVSDLVRDFDYKPSTSVQDGINQFVKWYKSYYKIEL